MGFCGAKFEVHRTPDKGLNTVAPKETEGLFPVVCKNAQKYYPPISSFFKQFLLLKKFSLQNSKSSLRDLLF